MEEAKGRGWPPADARRGARSAGQRGRRRAVSGWIGWRGEGRSRPGSTGPGRALMRGPNPRDGRGRLLAESADEVRGVEVSVKKRFLATGDFSGPRPSALAALVEKTNNAVRWQPGVLEQSLLGIERTSLRRNTAETPEPRVVVGIFRPAPRREHDAGRGLLDAIVSAVNGDHRSEGDLDDIVEAVRGRKSPAKRSELFPRTKGSKLNRTNAVDTARSEEKRVVLARNEIVRALRERDPHGGDQAEIRRVRAREPRSGRFHRNSSEKNYRGCI